MKKKILCIMFIAASLTIVAFLSGCPTNIQAGDYRLYTINGIVTKADEETGINNILIEVRNQKILEKNENVMVKFSSADENFLPVSVHGRSEDTANSSSVSEDSSSSNSTSSGDENSSSSSSLSGDSSSSSTSSNSSSSSTTEESHDDQSSDTKKSSPDENPILGSCRTATDGTFSLTFKSYDSDTNLTFIIYATDDDGNENGGLFKSNLRTITFEKIQNDEPANPYGTYKKTSQKYKAEIKIKMD